MLGADVPIAWHSWRNIADTRLDVGHASLSLNALDAIGEGDINTEAF